MQIALIIPFFQRQPGMLKHAVSSVASCMQGIEEIKLKIIVVDDASPVAAESELQNYQLNNDQITLTTIRQSNKGPGGARNTGLDSLTDSTQVVAFLDSDDTWSPDHLQHLCKAMSSGADFYFADHQRVAEPLTRFQECNFEQSKAAHSAGDVVECSSDIFYEILKQSPVGTSTVAYRFDKYKSVRFAENIRAGEDIMFWLDIASNKPRAFYSTSIEALYGRGVNIFHGVQWGTTADLIRLRDSAQFHQTVMTRYPLDERCFDLNKSYLKGIDQSFAKSLLGAVKHGEKSILPAWVAYFKLRPQFVLSAPMAVMQMIKPR